MDEKFPIEDNAAYSRRVQAELINCLEYITAESVHTEFCKRCSNGMQYTTFPNLITDEEVAKLEAKGYTVTKSTISGANRDGAPDMYIGFQVALNSTAASGHRTMQISQKETNGIGGGGGGTTDYNALSNKPSINSHTLQGNSTLDNLGIASKTALDAAAAEMELMETEIDSKVDKEAGKRLSTNDFTDTDKENLETALTKANAAAPQATTYTMTEVDTALAAKLNTADVDDALSSTSTNPVQNKAVQAPIARLVDAGAKNLLKNTATSQTINGVTFTVNADQTVTVNGTNTGSKAAVFQIANVTSAESYLLSGRYVISGCIGGSSSTFDLRFYRNSDGSNIVNYADGTQFEYTSGAWNVSILIRAGQTVNVTFKPMICTAEYYAISPEFVPYAPSNRELYEEVEKKVDILPADRKADDIDAAVDPGIYRFYSNTANLPSDITATKPFGLLEVFVCGLYTKQVLTYFVSMSQAVPPIVYIRRSVNYGETWGPWGKFEGTAVT